MHEYNILDQLLHRIAFASPGIQLLAANIEQRLFSADYRHVQNNPPVFITSLPRSGTTILLTALADFAELATQNYRDMPFVMTPLLWSRIAKRFHKKSIATERAHGDGIHISTSSPEAFEEIIWRAFWPNHYTGHQIDLWNVKEARDDALHFFCTHFRKLIVLRCNEGDLNGRYLSKNNGNIARLELIPQMFPDAKIVVPIRHPMRQAVSSLHQHLRFLKRHNQDPFAKRYMRDIGHYEFGELHRPVLFPGFKLLAEGTTPKQLDYWLAYWISANEYIRKSRSNVFFVSYEQLCEDAADTLRGICTYIGIDPAGREEIIGRRFHSPALAPETTRPFHDRLRARAEALHAHLLHSVK